MHSQSSVNEILLRLLLLHTLAHVVCEPEPHRDSSGLVLLTAHMIAAAVGPSRVSGIGVTWKTEVRTYSANVPSAFTPVAFKCGQSRCGRHSCCTMCQRRHLISTPISLVFFCVYKHRLLSRREREKDKKELENLRHSNPFLHISHRKQLSPRNLTPTRVPTPTSPVAPAPLVPNATTTPTPSCPPTRSFFTGAGYCPRAMPRSVWHTPVCVNRTRHSFGPSSNLGFDSGFVCG